MSKFLFLSLLFTFDSHGKTVEEVIKLIEKKQGKIPTYRNEKLKRKGGVKLRYKKSSGNFPVVFAEGTAERNYENKLNKEIDHLSYLAKKLKSKSTKQKVLMRLAKAYSEKAALIERREQERFDEKLKMYLNGSITRKPTLSLSKSKVYHRKALEIYQKYLKDYPRSNDRDQALFFLGYNSLGVGKTREAIKNFERLSARYPKSDFINEANLSLGNYYFEANEMKRAKIYYEKVIRKKSSMKNLALYKLAWVKYKMGSREAGLKDLLKVIRLSDGSNLRDKKSLALSAEAKKDLPMFYADAGDPRAAFTYFTNIMSREDASRAVEKLAYYYVDKGDRKEAEYLFGKLLRLNPQSERSFDYQYSLVSMQGATGKTRGYERELYNWVKKFGPQSEWARNSKNKKKVKESLEKLEFELRSHILKLHNQSRSSKSKAVMAKAEKGYDLYLKAFLKNPSYEEMKFYHAELLYEMGLYRKAHKTYLGIKSPKYISKASLNAVLSLGKVIPSDAAIRKKVGKSVEKFPLSPNEKLFIESGQKYLANRNNKEQRLEIEYRVASIYYSHNYFEESEAAFKKIIKDNPRSKYSSFASELIIDSYKLRKDYAGLERVGSELIKLGGSSGGVKTAKVKTIVEQSAFKKIEEIASKEEPFKVAQKFENFIKKYPNSGYVNQAYYNSGIYYEKAGAAKEALMSYSMVGRGEDGLYLKARKFSAFLYERTGYLNKASVAYEELGRMNDVGAKEKLQFLSNAATIREAFNDPSGMDRVFKVLNKYDKQTNIELYEYRLADAYDRIGETSQSLKHRIHFFNTSKASPFFLVKTARLIADQYKEKKDKVKAEYWFKKTLSSYTKNKKRGAVKASADAAHAKFELSDKLFHTYLRVKIPKDPSKQKAAIDKKLSLIGKINKEMGEIIGYDDGYSIVSALNRLGQAYQHLAFLILNAPLPKGLSAGEIKQVRGLLKKKVAPYKADAVKAYKKALEKAEQFNAYGPEHLKALSEMAKIDSQYFRYRIPYSSSEEFMYYSPKIGRAFSKDLKLYESDFLTKMSKVLIKNSKDDKALFSLAQYYSFKRLSRLSNVFLDKTSKKFRNTAPFYNLKGINKILENKRRLAIFDFKKALRLNSKNVAANVNLSTLYSLYGGYKESGRLLGTVYPVVRSLLEKKIKNSVANNFALSLFQKGDFSGGFSELKSVFSSDRQNIFALANLSIVEKVLIKNKNLDKLYLSQYKRLAKYRGDLDRIRLLEKM